MHTAIKKVGLALASIGFGFGLALPAQAGVPAITSIKVTGPSTITILYSEAVTANAGDYTNFTGSLGGRSVSSLGGNGSNTIVLTLNGEPLPANATGYITVGTNTFSVNDRAPFPGGIFSATDGQAPSLISFGIASVNGTHAIGKLATSFTLNFSVNEAVSSISANVLGRTLPISGSGAGPYSLTYSVVSGDTEGVVPVSLAYTDTAGNTGRSSFTLTSGASSVAAPVTHTITSNANAAGILKIGDSIQFTLTPATMQPNARVNGSYNGVPLSWYTTNGGVTYTATYVVAAGNAEQPYPLQISGVVLTDQFGVAGQPISSTDIAKTIVASSPTIYEITAVPSLSMNATPAYSFHANKAGTIRLGGPCTSQSTFASAGANTITFNRFAPGVYAGCTISIVDSVGNVSNQLALANFTISEGAVATTPSAPTAPTTVTGADALAAQLAALQAQLASAQSGQTATPARYVFTKALQLGSSGTEVLELQKRLVGLGYLKATPNGNYGPATQAAVKAFQRAKGLSQLGNVGPATRAALNK